MQVLAHNSCNKIDGYEFDCWRNNTATAIVRYTHKSERLILMQASVDRRRVSLRFNEGQLRRRLGKPPASELYASSRGDSRSRRCRHSCQHFVQERLRHHHRRVSRSNDLTVVISADSTQLPYQHRRAQARWTAHARKSDRQVLGHRSTVLHVRYQLPGAGYWQIL